MRYLNRTQSTLVALIQKGMTDEDVAGEMDIEERNWLLTIRTICEKMNLKGMSSNHIRQFFWGYVPQEYWS